jgi:triphosphoribosyl-dephospho-CoA synthase
LWQNALLKNGEGKGLLQNGGDEKNFLRWIGDTAIRAILCEVAATPKPGLVDRHNNGAHDDMDFFTFMASTAALRGAFETLARIGAEARALPPVDAFPPLRRAGVDAEKKMFAATGGVNTHKGAIFSLGLICAAAGRIGCSADPEDVCAVAASLCAGVCDEAYGGLDERIKDRPPTKGERVWLEHGIRGVRGEAEDGFPSVLCASLPAYREMKKNGAPENDALVQALLHLMATVHDTNIISRHDIAASRYVQERARRALDLGGMTTEAGKREVYDADRDFIARNISPGGCADLLALTYFLDGFGGKG